MSTTRPAPFETSEYYRYYVDAAPDGPIVDVLRRQIDEAIAELSALDPALHDHRYEPGKWTLKEVVGHIVDIEWVFTTRAMRIARGDTTPQTGVDQDVLVGDGNFDTRVFDDLLDEWRHLRAANTSLFASFDDAVLDRRGVAWKSEFTVRGILYILAGHTAHHLRVVRERYVGGAV